MAFLVCYSRTPPHDHTKDKAIYLNQEFYEIIFAECRRDKSDYNILSDIASLKYKSPTLVVPIENLAALMDELRLLLASEKHHPQIQEFQNVCAKAIELGCSLTISGDMYPELWS